MYSEYVKSFLENINKKFSPQNFTEEIANEHMEGENRNIEIMKFFKQ